MGGKVPAQPRAEPGRIGEGMNIPTSQNEVPQLRTLDEYIHDELHRIFTHVAEVMAADESNPEQAAAIPIFAFRAENYMRAAWDNWNISAEIIERAT